MLGRVGGGNLRVPLFPHLAVPGLRDIPWGWSGSKQLARNSPAAAGKCCGKAAFPSREVPRGIMTLRGSGSGGPCSCEGGSGASQLHPLALLLVLTDVSVCPPSNQMYFLSSLFQMEKDETVSDSSPHIANIGRLVEVGQPPSHHPFPVTQGLRWPGVMESPVGSLAYLTLPV